MRWLVTGAGGFVGGHMARHLAAAGHQVFAASRSENPAEEHSGITPLKLDITDIHAFSPSMGFEAVLHCAALSPADQQPASEMMRVNVDGSAALARWSVKHNIPHFIHFSAVSLYGEPSGLIDEATWPVHPDDYGKSKQLAEQAIAKERAGKSSISLRLPGVLGKGAKNIWLSSVLQKLKTHQPVEYFNGSAPFNNAVHVNDLLYFIRQLTHKAPVDSAVLLLGAGSAMPFNDVLSRLKTLTSSRSDLIEQPAKKPAFHLDIKKAQARGYAPMNLEQMLETYVKDEAGV